jgi:hypothetical protein
VLLSPREVVVAVHHLMLGLRAEQREHFSTTMSRPA